MNHDKWIPVIEEAYRATGSALSPDVMALLLTHPSASPATSLSEEQKKAIIDAIEIMMKYFFKKAVKGDTFGSLERIKEKFGATLEENYGLFEGPFLNMARTYWTYQNEVFDLVDDQRDYYLTEVLLAVENNIRCVFFPTPGPNKVAVRKRIDAQRDILHDYAPDFDIQRFLTESPILKAESRRSGCLAALLVLLAPIMGAVGYAISKYC